MIDIVVGQRVGTKAELEGLDLPEMGALCYPEFEIKTRSVAEERKMATALQLLEPGQAPVARPSDPSFRFPGETLTRSRRRNWRNISACWRRRARRIRDPPICELA